LFAHFRVFLVSGRLGHYAIFPVASGPTVIHPESPGGEEGAVLDTIYGETPNNMAWPKVLNGRVATEADAHEGRVVFHIPDSRSTIHLFDNELPLTAKVDDGGEAVSMLEKVEVIGPAPENPPFSI
jgi:hypothetical protein